MYMFIKGDILDKLDEIDNDSIDLVFTSPPYWKGFGYESYFNSYLQYINWTKDWIKKIKPKIKQDGYFLLNMCNDSITTIKAYEILECCTANGFKLHDTIIWYKPNNQQTSTNKQLANRYEFIFMLRHNSNNVNIHKEGIIEKYPDVFFNLKIVGNLWKIPFKIYKDSKLKKQHKTSKNHSGFPPVLCELVIDLFTEEEDTILDPFCGNFLLENIAQSKNRKIIGIDLN